MYAKWPALADIYALHVR